MTDTEDLGPEPTPTAEPPEPLPGGVDSEDDPRYGTTLGTPTTPDLPPSLNPVDDVVPDDVSAPDDKPQENTADVPDEDAGETSEPTA